MRQVKQAKIRAANVERQKNRLGSGLKPRFFRPRPAFEKRLWKLGEKPEED